MNMNSLIVVCALSVALMSACSQAPSADTRFVAALTSQRIPGDRGVEIGLAHQVCHVLQRIAAKEQTPILQPGSWFYEWKGISDQLVGQGLTQEQIALHFTVDAVDAYCPETREQLKQLEQGRRPDK